MPERSGVHVECFPGPGTRPYGSIVREFAAFLKRHPIVRRNCAIFIPHVMHFAANYFVSSRRHAWLGLLPDGMINYADRRPGPSERLKNLAKIFVGARYGVSYWPISGLRHITGYDRDLYDATFTFNRQGLVSRGGEVIVLDIANSRQSPAGDPERIVFLDQEVSELLDPEEERVLRARVASYFRHKAPRTLFYKPHPKGVSRAEDMAKALSRDVEVLPGAMPIEEVTAELNVGEFVSFYSTALVSLRRETGAKVSSILPVSRKGRAAAFFADIEASFRSQGIQIVSPDSQDHE
ncbi:glycosyltransferase family 52 [Tistrella mobilis]|uniref:glycosyltransferase family 52 n=1 Tax=Tistrella mobilis TaxID=171437 RepID=UPI0035571F95